MGRYPTVGESLSLSMLLLVRLSRQRVVTTIWLVAAEAIPLRETSVWSVKRNGIPKLSKTAVLVRQGESRPFESIQYCN